MSITINGATNTISSTGTVTLPTVAGVTSLGNTALGDAEASDTHAIKGATTLLANSASAALTVTQTGAGNAFVVEDSASTDSTPFVIDANGNLLIGYSTQLTVTGAGSRWQGAGTGQEANVALIRYSDTAGTAPNINLARARGSVVGTNTVVQSGDVLASINFGGGDGSALLAAAQISALVDGTPGTNDMPGRLVFSTTADGASSPTERMRIDSAGSVGIGASGLAGFKVTTGGTSAGAISTGDFTATQTINPAVSTVAHSVYSNFNAVSAGSLPTLSVYLAQQATFTGTVGSQFGFHANSTLTGANNNYGFYSNIAAAANRFNFYAAGTAPNYFGGNVTVGGGGTLGYGAGSGGTVTQASTRTTGVTLNKPSGDVTLVSAAGSATYQSLTVTNSAVEATDSISCSQKSGTDLYEIHTTNVAAGSFRITYRTTGGTTTEQPVFHFNVIKGAAS